MKYSDPQLSPAYQLWLASNAWQRALRRAMEPLELTHVQFVILASVDKIKARGEEPTQIAVCRFADLDENMTSQVTRSLIGRGLVSREKHPTDGRAYTLRLTAEGPQTLAEARTAAQPVIADFFAPLGDREKEFIELLQILNQHHEKPCDR